MYLKRKWFLFAGLAFVTLMVIAFFATPAFAGGGDCQGKSCEDVPGHECEHGQHTGNPHCDDDGDGDNGDDRHDEDDDDEDKNGDDDRDDDDGDDCEDEDDGDDDNDGDDDDDCPPTPTPVPTSTPTPNPTPTPTATATPTEEPPPTSTPTPTATPTEPPLTKEPEEEVTVLRVEAVCLEEDVKVEVRLNTDTGIANIWRIWVDDATGQVTDELLLTDHPLLLGSVNLFPSISDDCWVYFSSWAEGQEHADLWRVSVHGAQSGIYRMTYTPEVDERNPDWSVKDRITFDHNSFIYETNMWGSYFNPLFEGEHPVSSPDGEKLAYAVSGLVHIWDGVNHSSTGYEGIPVTWMQDGSGLVGIFEGVLQLLDYESGELVFLGAWDDYAPDPRKVYVADLGEMFDQVWWVMPETEMLLTGDVPGQSLGEFSAQAAEQVEEMNRMPDWWVRASDRAEFNSALVDAYLDRLAAESASAETASAPTPGCPDYQGYSIVECLDVAGLDSSVESRYQLAQQYGVENYDRSADKNTELLELLRGT